MLKGKLSLNFQKSAVLLLTVFVLTIPATSCSIFPKERNVNVSVQLNDFEKFAYNLVEVEKKSYIKSIEGEGVIQPTDKIDVSFDNGGYYVKRVNFVLGDFVKRGDILLEANSDELIYNIKKQENALMIAQLDYQEIKSISGDKYELDKANINVETEKTKLDKLKELLGKTKIISPMDGVITYTKDIKKGSMLNPNEILFQISDAKDIEILYKSKDVSNLQKGMRVSIQYQNEYYEGEVTSVDLSTVSKNKSSWSLPSASIKLLNTPKSLKIGESVKFNIDVLKKENVIVIPGSAISLRDGKKYVIVLENNTRVEKEIITGFEMGFDVEVISGLNVGDKVIVE